MIILQYSLILALGTSGLGLYFMLKKLNRYNSKVWRRLVVVLLALVFFVRFMSGKDAMANIFKLQGGVFESGFLNFISLILNWFLYANILLVCIGEFFDNKTIKFLRRFFALPVSVGSALFIVPVSMGVVGRELYYVFHFRVVLQVIEIVLLFLYSFRFSGNSASLILSEKKQ